MSILKFDGEMVRRRRTAGQHHDAVVRRSAVLGALNLRTGERVLDIGCGGGFYAYEAARFVGPTGRVCSIDLSADQVAATRERCADLTWVECQVADAVDLPYGEAEFDAVYSVQVLEYVADLDRALREIQRVLHPGGRLVNLATNFSSLVWHSEHPERMKRVLAAFEEHAYYNDLPAILAARLWQAGMQPLRQTPVPVLNMSHHENSYSYWLARVIRPFVVSRQGVTEEEADTWLQEFEELGKKGEYFFCLTPVLTEAVRIS